MGSKHCAPASNIDDMQYTQQPSSREKAASGSRLLGRALLYAALVIVVTSVGCGASQKAASSPAARATALHSIAADYAQDKDLDQAKKALANMKLANPGQVILVQAEQEMAQKVEREQIQQLSDLAAAMGARSPQLIAYLAPSATPAPEPTDPPAAQPIPTDPALSQAATQPVPLDAPTATTAAPTAAPQPTSTPATAQVTARMNANVRSGPGAAYAVIGQLVGGRSYAIVARNAGGDWWRITYPSEEQAWVSGTVVDVANAGSVALAQNIPTPAPTPIPPPTSPPAPTKPPAPAQPTAVPAPPGMRYVIKSLRLRAVGESAQHCTGGDHNIWVFVEDPSGQRIDGVRVHEIYTNSIVVSGSKGPGAASWDIYRGGGGQVDIVDESGNRIGELSRGMSDDWPPFDLYLAAGYCTCKPYPDAASCQAAQEGHNEFAGIGHFVYEVTYRRTY
jgi:uncharacterized protein YgiM (DUF1202 family)